MAKVIIYSKTYCPFCVRAKSLFDGKGVAYEEIMVDSDPQMFMDLKKKTGMMTVPQIFIDDQLIGGYTELAALDRDGGLDPLLASKPS
jgi:glutaredoxin 3